MSRLTTIVLCATFFSAGMHYFEPQPKEKQAGWPQPAHPLAQFDLFHAYSQTHALVKALAQREADQEATQQYHAALQAGYPFDEAAALYERVHDAVEDQFGQAEAAEEAWEEEVALADYDTALALGMPEEQAVAQGEIAREAAQAEYAAALDQYD